jgi:transposase-like protein
VSRANEQLKEGFQEWRRRDLTGEQVLFLFLDGYYAGVRQGTTEKEALLVAHGLNRSGKRVFLGIGLGVHESTESWKLALDDLVARGLPAPLLVISDGNPGLMAAVKKTWPAVPRQRCILHRMRNILERIPKTERKRIRKALTRIFYAPSEPEALEEARRFVRAQSETYPSACEVLVTDLADCLTFFRFPQPYWKRLRTSNPLERQFREVRRRTRVIGRFPNELAALSLVWAVLEEERLKWRGIRVSEERAARIFEAHRSLLDVPISTEDLEEILAA